MISDDYFEDCDDELCDPGNDFFEDATDEYYPEDDVGEHYFDDEDGEVDSPGINPINLATAAGFGYHMAVDEYSQHKQMGPSKPKKFEKIPLKFRHEKKGVITKFAKWAMRANDNPKEAKKGIEYTKEEQIRIIKAEGE
ncbi:MAG: hypothetical protein PVG39_07955 [Desulfobacteraceae bacterium]|jgi:hypothetical protein